MQVCVLMPVLDPYKGGNHLSLFAACEDTSFTIVCNRSKVPANELPPNVAVEIVPGRIGPYYYGVSDFLFARSVLKHFPVQSDFWRQFSVIHLNQVMGPAFRTLQRTGVPVLFLVHHPVVADRAVAVSESGFFQGLVWRAKYALLVRWQRKMCRAADVVATVSETMKSYLAQCYGCTEKQIAVVPNGVDGSRFTTIPDTKCDIDVIALGSFVHPRKGFPYLVKVYCELAAAGFSVADVGRRSDEQRHILKQIDGVTLHGTVDELVLADLVQRSKVLISTSLFEGFGLSLIEALASGHPAFAFSVGAVPEVLGGIDPNLVISAKDTKAMAQAVTDYLRLSGADRDAQAARYREAVLKRYSLGQSADSLQSLYRSFES